MSHTEIVNVLDCGCVIKEAGGRVWCPSCLEPPRELLTVRGAQQMVTAWADQVFPDRTVKGTLSKMMCEELPEFITSELRDPLEYADLLILVLDLAGQMRIDVEDALRRKMEINRKRKWRRDPDTGNWRHIREESDHESNNEVHPARR